ncbi:sigma-70 family RNA polymerase sigma factor [Undibacterium sp. Ji83W]|uniref:sigma-70 family RNA polymerase sigma factor n=1 Tax=Undibacterium sp. Ji83W TaxID=3413043 RepID=UPI003BF3E5E3
MAGNANEDILVQGTDSEESEAVLWANWKTNADFAAREQLIEIYMPYAKSVAASMYVKRYGNDVEFAEYNQIALVGMLDAMERFNLGAGTKFTSFAGPRMRGAILNSMEVHSEKHQQISVRQRLNAQRMAASKEMALLTDSANPDDSEQIFRCLAEVGLGLALSWLLDDSGMVSNEGLTSLVPPVYESLELKQLQEQIRSLVEQLSRQEQKVVRYHYLQSTPFEEVAEIMNVSKGRVSQIHQSALKNLKRLLAAQRDCDLAC